MVGSTKFWVYLFRSSVGIGHRWIRLCIIWIYASSALVSSIGIFKLNFDCNCMREISLAGYGGVICNGLGFTGLSFADLIPNGSVI